MSDAPDPSLSPTDAPGLYARLCAPDRDFGSDRHRNPLVAAALSGVFPGLGQLYNRQLIRAAWWAIFVFATLVLWAVLGLIQLWPFAIATPDWRGRVGAALDELHLAFLIITGGLWLFGMIDALRVGLALRSAKVVVRFSFKKQAALLAAGLVPLAGALVPDETCSLDELRSPLSHDLAQKLIKRLIARKLRRVLLLLVLLVGVLPLLLGAVYALPWLTVIGAVTILLAALALLTY